MSEFTALAATGCVFLAGIGFYLCLLAGKQRKLQNQVHNLEGQLGDE